MKLYTTQKRQQKQLIFPSTGEPANTSLLADFRFTDAILKLPETSRKEFAGMFSLPRFRWLKTFGEHNTFT